MNCIVCDGVRVRGEQLTMRAPNTERIFGMVLTMPCM